MISFFFSFFFLSSTFLSTPSISVCTVNKTIVIKKKEKKEQTKRKKNTTECLYTLHMKGETHKHIMGKERGGKVLLELRWNSSIEVLQRFGNGQVRGLNLVLTQVRSGHFEVCLACIFQLRDGVHGASGKGL